MGCIWMEQRVILGGTTGQRERCSTETEMYPHESLRKVINLRPGQGKFMRSKASIVVLFYDYDYVEHTQCTTPLRYTQAQITRTSLQIPCAITPEQIQTQIPYPLYNFLIAC